jgi:HEAT repeat protein
LGRINQKNDAATRALVDGAKEGAPLLKVMSWWALARQNPDRPDVVKGAARRIAEALVSDDAHLRNVAARALVEFEAPREVVRAELLKVLQHADPAVIQSAMGAMAALGPAALEDIDDVLAHPVARHFATLVIFRMGSDAAPAVPDLIDALKAAGDTEDDDQFRREAQMALSAIGPDAVAAVPVLIESLASDHKEVRGSACYALGKIGPAAAEAVPALESRLDELEDSGKVAFVWALLAIKPGDEALGAKAVPLLVDALDAPDELVRMEAAGALGRIGEAAAQPNVIAELKKLLDDPAPEVQEAAAAALKALE